MQSLLSSHWLALLALAVFQLKHFACDFALQTPRQIQAKAFYGRRGGLEHAGLHAVASIPALLVLTQSAGVIAVMVIGELVVHYHVDFAKARIDKLGGYTETTRAYWLVFGLDQLIHQMTYLVIVTVLLGLQI
jgi:uncharacterized protein DUF3307